MSILLADIDATCAALGYSDGQKYYADPDALQGLKHLIWILRRDNENHEYRRHLGHSKVLQTDLVYMLPDYVDNDEFADVLIRLLVILTTPTLLLYRDGPPEDNHGRKVFLELIDMLQDYKNAFTRLPIWSALFGKLQKSLEIDWALRSEEQSLLIERILVLIRNVLQVPANPELECRADNDASVHDQVIWVLHQSGVLDLVLFITSSPDEHQFHLHSLEILCLLYREQTAESLADASLQRSTSEKQRDEQELIIARQREKQRLAMRPPAARHSRFGGTYVIRNMKSISDRDIICHQPLERAVALDFDREKQQQKRSYRVIKEESQGSRRSTFSVRLCLREFCIEILRSSYNILVRQVRRVLERKSGSRGHDDSYLLWAIRFFMEFNRLSGLQLHLVSESLSVQCFHWILTRMQHDMDMIVSDKKQSRLWAKRLHVAIQAFRELLQSLLALQKLTDPKAKALFDMLLNNICYVMEYRETILHLLINYNETHSTKAYLRDVIETANTFLKMMEKFCKDSVLVQDKRRTKKYSEKKPKEVKAIETEEQLADRWAQMAGEVTIYLTNELQLPEEEQPLPFDSTSEKSIDDQKEDCMIRIHKFLRKSEPDKAVALLRAAREVWPENDVFGAFTAAPEDELLLLREIFLHNIATDDDHANDIENNEDGNIDADADVNEEDLEDDGVVEKTLKFEDFAKRLLNPKIVRACIVVLKDWECISTKSLKATVTILHRIAYGCSCPAMLYQATLFRIFQNVFNSPRDAHHEELRRLGVFVVRKFVVTAPNNPKIFAELLFYKSVREANELESGYCDTFDSGTKGTWTEEQETELRLLFEENQRNPESDKDVIDWILENLIDKTRTRRGVLKKLKEMGLTFKAPTRKSTATTVSAKNLWNQEEDEELRSLYDQHRTEPDCLDRILKVFGERRNKQQIIKRMLQLYIIADKSEILPQKQRKRKLKKQLDNEKSELSELIASDASPGTDRTRANASSKRRKNQKRQSKKSQLRKVIRNPLDVGTVRMLLDQINTVKYQEAIEWLKECLSDAADETEEPAEEDDGVPLLPLLEIQKEAMDDTMFQKVLLALGMQPPIVGTENYWRIPIYLNAADLRLRLKIISGEVIEDDVNDNGNEDDKCNDEEDVLKEDNVNQSASENDEHLSDDLENYVDQRRDNLNNLIYSKSDNEDELRMSHKPKRGQRKSRQQMNKREDDDSDSTNDIENESNKKSIRRKQQKRSVDKNIKEKKIKKSEKSETYDLHFEISESNTDSTFDRLKAERVQKATKTPAETIIQTNRINENDDEINFNSEDYRKRLLELGDSDEDENEDREKSRTIGANNTFDIGSSLRFNVNDSNDVIKEKPNKDENQTGVEILIDRVNNDSVEDEESTSNSNNKKRRRFVITHAIDDSEDDDNNSVVKNDVNSDDENSLFTKHPKPSIEHRLPAVAKEKPAKRRRLAIIDEDDE